MAQFNLNITQGAAPYTISIKAFSNSHSSLRTFVIKFCDIQPVFHFNPSEYLTNVLLNSEGSNEIIP